MLLITSCHLMHLKWPKLNCMRRSFFSSLRFSYNLTLWFVSIFVTLCVYSFSALWLKTGWEVSWSICTAICLRRFALFSDFESVVCTTQIYACRMFFFLFLQFVFGHSPLSRVCMCCFSDWAGFYRIVAGRISVCRYVMLNGSVCGDESYNFGFH